jgi:hypothetical protein
MKSKATGICRLCKQEKILLSKSHLIPEFVFDGSGVYDAKHKINVYEIKDGDLKFSHRISSGEYEGGLLCKSCDGDIIGKLETYAKNILYGDDGRFKPHEKASSHIFQYPDGMRFLHVENVVYTKFKLFQLSVLWRASISSRPFFKNVTLPPQVEEDIRQMILNNDAKEEMTYPCILINATDNTSHLASAFCEPYQFRNEKGYVFLIGGILYLFCLSGDSLPPPFMENIIKKSNKLIVLQPPIGKGIEMMRGMITGSMVQ